MKITSTKHLRGAGQKVTFSIKGGDAKTFISDPFNINDLAEICFKFEENFSVSHYIKWKKHKSVTENFTVKIDIMCESESLKYSKQLLCHQNWTDWLDVGSIKNPTAGTQPIFGTFGAPPSKTPWASTLQINMSATKVESITFAKLYEDEEFCDFNLAAVDNSASVPVHKACLIIHSDMFRRMLSSEWKETLNGCLKIHGVTLQTLKYLKEYMYVGTLPDDTDELKSLLLIAKCYMVENLKTECIMKLAVSVDPSKLHSLQEFAIDNKLSELVQAIIQITPDRVVQEAHKIEKDKGLPPAVANESDDGY